MWICYLFVDRMAWLLVSSCSNRCIISLWFSKTWEFCVYFGCVCIYTIDLVILHPEFLVMQSSVFLCCPIELMHMMHLLDEKTLLFDSNGINLFPCKTSWCLNRKDCLFLEHLVRTLLSCLSCISLDFMVLSKELFE